MALLAHLYQKPNWDSLMLDTPNMTGLNMLHEKFSFGIVFFFSSFPHTRVSLAPGDTHRHILLRTEWTNMPNHDGVPGGFCIS